MNLQEALKIVESDPSSIPQALVIDSGAAAGEKTDFMSIAICIADKSKQEKPTKFFDQDVPQPKIGAVLVIGDKAYCSARSGYKIGDHAEYTVINTMAKKDTSDFSSAILFTTLEPCTPESRKSWTECCCSLVVDSGIREVYVGSFDANPLVTGAGIKAMIDGGVDVQLFPNEYAIKCRELNREFFSFFGKVADFKAIKRVADAVWGDLDLEAVKFYCTKRGIISEETKFDHYSAALFLEEMIKRNSIKDGDGLSKVNVSDSFAIAFFRDPSIKVPGYGIDFYDERSKSAKAGVAKARSVIKNSALICCRDLAPKKTGDVNNIFARILREYKTESLDKLFSRPVIGREIFENAVVHNDYRADPRISVSLFSDHVEIRDAACVGSEEINDLNEGRMPSIPQNPELMEYFEICGLAEHHHFGMSEVENAKTIPFAYQKDHEKQDIFKEEKKKGVQFLVARLSVN